MIYDNGTRLSVYHSLPGIAAAADFLHRMNPDALTPGKIRLGGGVFVNVNCYAPEAESKWEAHRSYIDLQYVVRGNETMASVLLEDALDASAYDEKKDVQFFADAKDGRAVEMQFGDGDFALFFPGDVHMPGLRNEQTAGEVCKLVFKIPVPAYAHIAHVAQLADTVALPDDAKEAVMAAAERIPAEVADRLTANYFAGESVKEDICALAGELGITEGLCFLVMYMIFAKQTYYNYLAKGIDPAVYNESMTDLAVWCETHRKKTGAPGLSELGWLDCTLKEGLYRIGRFQYQPTTFAHPFYKYGDYELHKGDPVITIHIPEGAPLTDEARYDSYRRAEAFFGKHVFVCESWLLYPAHRDFLQAGSNIVRFMDDFVLLASEEHRGDLGNLWRMYGFACDHHDFASLPEDTGMQRAYKKHLTETGGMTGEGYGILIVENGTIIGKQ